MRVHKLIADPKRVGLHTDPERVGLRVDPHRVGLYVALICFMLAAGLGPVRGQQGAGAEGEWRAYGGDLGNTKYSPLDADRRRELRTAAAAWRWKSADGFISRTLPGGGEVWASSRDIFAQLDQEDPKRWRDRQPPFVQNFKATPLMVGGRLFLNTPFSIGAAIDAKTGRTLWVYNPKSYEAGTTTMSARWNQRGVAYWTRRQGRAGALGHGRRLSARRRREDGHAGPELRRVAARST